MLKVVKHPHPALRYESRPVSRIDDALRTTIAEMFELMYEHRGIGLAANQVAIPYRFFVLNLTADRERRDEELVFINPEIVKRHSTFEGEEGCLSFPGLYGEVRRARKIKVQAYNLRGEPIEVEAEDLLSRAIQHELDHLAGKLFIDYLDTATLKSFQEKLRDFEREHRAAQTEGALPSDAELKRLLDEA